MSSTIPRATDSLTELQKVETIFHAALECEPGEVSAFLDSACGGNEFLRRKIEELLSSDEQASDFFESPPRTLAAKVVESEAAQPESPIGRTIGNYEVIELLGRGGQGVVYRARQKGLNRTVALKVIGLGQWATEAHLKRFRLEAAAAASLDHPCIVPIYEVGERDGSCYFSMKFLEGGQLDEVIRRTPMPMRQAAELMAKVARTVHYAHEHGILHRDIKPGNILLDAKGEPHLTDFGLARLLESESPVTRTLEVLGTPSYMAPEQAAGNNPATRLTSATDVYGLGAVLYQLLTGHPPFAGGTTYETIKLVLETEPRQPRLWNPKIDRDLSTICLKCLEKEPAKRYASAQLLAEDIERFLRNEPIRSRRSSRLEHVWRWCKRKPLVASLIAALILIVAVGTAGVLWELPRVQEERALAGRAKLAAQEKARLEAEQTNHPAAYDAYLRGRAFPGGWHLDGAIRLFQEAVKLDPNFVLAWAYLSIAQSQSYWLGTDPSAARLAAAKGALDRALALDQTYRKLILLLAITAITDRATTPERWRNPASRKGSSEQR